MSRKVNLDLERSPVGLGLRKVGQWVTYDEFTDGGGASGTKTLAKQIPAGSFVLGSKVKVTEGFSGDTTAVMDIGDGSDADLFSLTTHNVLSAASNLVEGAAAGTASDSYSGIVPIASDTTITLTVTGASDFGLITAGKMFVEVFYLSTNPEVIDKVATRYDL
jgi:hypothetical protein